MSKNKKQELLIRFLVCGIMILLFANLCLAQEESLYDPAGKRDPFIPLVTPDGRFQRLEAEEESKKKETELKLNGIIYDKYGISYAIVNDNVVKTGDSIQDYRVLKIEEKKVTFIREGQTTEISIKKEGEK
jgi:hypothetical protein